MDRHTHDYESLTNKRSGLGCMIIVLWVVVWVFAMFLVTVILTIPGGREAVDKVGVEWWQVLFGWWPFK